MVNATAVRTAVHFIRHAGSVSIARSAASLLAPPGRAGEHVARRKDGGSGGIALVSAVHVGRVASSLALPTAKFIVLDTQFLVFDTQLLAFNAQFIILLTDCRCGLAVLWN